MALAVGRHLFFCRRNFMQLSGATLYSDVMKNLKYLLIGIVFGLALTKGEAISWFRMQEMFHFQAFHMYGIFMAAAPVGAISILILKRLNVHTIHGEAIDIPKKPYHHGIILGGLIFGFGWAFTGACPGPLYAHIGAGYLVTLVTFRCAMAGTWFSNWLQPFLPD
jgi:uncharacterized membrane protein YedE/YeeE